MCKELVTVIMPVYNAEKYLAEAIESILVQTYSNFEFIITNDGSTDSSEDIIKKYAAKDKRIRMVSRENKGLVYTLNEQINMSNRKYIVRMDADDISHKERIYKQVHYMENNQDIYLAGCYYDMLVEPGTDEEIVKCIKRVNKNVNKFNDKIPQHMFLGYVLIHPTWIFRKELIENIGGYGDYRHFEDGEFLFRTLAAGYRIGTVPEKLFQYRVYNSSKSGSDRLSNTGLKEDMINYHIEYLAKNFQGKFDKKYLVWGADITGSLAVKKIQERFPEARFQGYIDSFAEPDNGKQIYKPDFINNNENYYVFIATNGGLSYAVDYLEEIGRNKIKDYFSVV
ncbi:MAG: glycosyltransferase [Lachnospiraceae bacterium]|nr:glycosyltransferase [Lachnospiraceae bacterium]